MSFPEAFITCMGKWVTFSGRARRSEYWWFSLATAIVGFLGSFLDAILDTRIFVTVVYLVLLLPFLAVSVRRLHDTGRSAWTLLLGFVPVVSLVLLVFLCQESKPGSNQYGPSPLYPRDQALVG